MSEPLEGAEAFEPRPTPPLTAVGPTNLSPPPSRPADPDVDAAEARLDFDALPDREGDDDYVAVTEDYVAVADDPVLDVDDREVDEAEIATRASADGGVRERVGAADLDLDADADGDDDDDEDDLDDEAADEADADEADADEADAEGAVALAGATEGGAPRKRRRRGSRGGRSRNRRPAPADGDEAASGPPSEGAAPSNGASDAVDVGLPGGPRAIVDIEGTGAAGLAPGGSPPGPRNGSQESEREPLPARAQARRPQIGDTRPAPGGAAPLPAPRGRVQSPAGGGPAGDPGDAGEGTRKRRRRGGRGRAGEADDLGDARPREGEVAARREPGEGRSRASRQPVEMLTGEPVESDPETLERRRGRERKGRPVGRYLMCVHSQPQATQIAVLEGRLLIEHYISHPQDDANQIDGNIYYGRVQNVLPGMEAAFVDIGTPKNAVLYRGDIHFDAEDVEGPPIKSSARIEQLLKVGQMIVCQVTKNPIAHKGARLTQEVSLPGRFVVFIPNSSTYGISKRLSDDERKRLRRILDDVKPGNHGLIVRTAAEGASADELRRDVARLASQWERIEALAHRTKGPALLYREPDLAVRVIREEFNKEYRGVVIDNPALYEDVRDYVASISPELADRVELYDEATEGLPIFERFHIHEQLHKAIDRKVWLPSGGSLIIERTEALTVIDVNTGKNVGTSNLEETVYRNNLEAADEIARQLRLRDIGGIIVIDFIDMEIVANRNDVVRAFRDALARDKTRTQVFDISELGLVEMTRKRISEGLVESLSKTCPMCEGRGIIFDPELLG
jgi:ribonuclease E